MASQILYRVTSFSQSSGVGTYKSPGTRMLWGDKGNIFQTAPKSNSTSEIAGVFLKN